jgi:small subunit ribosomal protein S17
MAEKKKTTEKTPVTSAEDAVVEAVAEDVEVVAAEVVTVEDAIEEQVAQDVEGIAAEVVVAEESIEEDAADAIAEEIETGEESEEAVVEAVADGVITPDEGVEAIEAIEEAVSEAVAEEVVEAAVAEEVVEEAAAEVIAEEVVEAAVVEEALEATDAEQPSVPAPQSGPKVKKKRLPRALRPQKTRPTRTKSAERLPIVRLEKPEHDRGRSQERQGTVVSAAMDKTIVVKVEVTKSHRKYKKVVRRSVKFHAHDEGNTAKLGDVVRIVETRPLSATKRWRLTEIVEVAK